MRRKPLLTYFVLCAIPLLLFAALNYWNGLRSVDSIVGTIVQNDLNALNVAIDDELRGRKSDFLRLSMMEEIKFLVDEETAAQAIMPQGLYLRLRTLPDLSRRFQSLTLFTRDRKPAFVREGDSEWTTIKDPQAANALQPDSHVWELQGNVSFEKPGNSTSTLEYAAPIHDLRGYIATCAYNRCHERVRERYALTRYPVIYAYGDTPEDAELLALAHRRYAL